MKRLATVVVISVPFSVPVIGQDHDTLLLSDGVSVPHLGSAGFDIRPAGRLSRCFPQSFTPMLR